MAAPGSRAPSTRYIPAVTRPLLAALAVAVLGITGCGGQQEQETQTAVARSDAYWDGKDGCSAVSLEKLARQTDATEATPEAVAEAFSKRWTSTAARDARQGCLDGIAETASAQ